MSGTVSQDWPAEGVLRLTFSNPGKRNALDHPILDGIAAALADTDARCIVIAGADGVFSSGYDLGDFREDELYLSEAEKLVAQPYAVALDALDNFDRPSVCAVAGFAIGGGLELALACDFRIAAEDAQLGMPPARLGLGHSHTGLRRFIDAVGVPRTRELFLLGQNIDGRTALAWGMVNRVTQFDAVDATAVDLAREPAKNSPFSISGNKRAIRTLLEVKWLLDSEVEQQLLELRRASFASDDLREGVRAFSEKRAPRWRWRPRP